MYPGYILAAPFLSAGYILCAVRILSSPLARLSAIERV